MQNLQQIVLRKNLEIKNNMKSVLLILLTLITLNCYSQKIVEIPEEELEEFFLAIDTLKQQD